MIGTLMVQNIVKYARASMMAYSVAGSVASDSISGIRTLTSFSAQERQTNIFDKLLLQCTRLTIKKRLAQALGVGAMIAVVFISDGVGLYYGTVLLVDDVTFVNLFYGYIFILFFHKECKWR